MTALYPFQQRAISALTNELDASRDIECVIPMGCGADDIKIEMARRYGERGLSVCMVTDKVRHCAMHKRLKGTPGRLSIITPQSVRHHRLPRADRYIIDALFLPKKEPLAPMAPCAWFSRSRARSLASNLYKITWAEVAKEVK